MRARERGKHPGRRALIEPPRESDVTTLGAEVAAHHETGPRLTGGDVDADWVGAWGAGDEAVGGSVSTPDQDIVDEIGEALGVGQAPDAELVTSGEILAERDRHRWDLECDADEEEPRRRGRRRR